jgi:hypothetical protein
MLFVLKLVSSLDLVSSIVAFTLPAINIFVLMVAFEAKRVPFVPIDEIRHDKGITVVPRIVLVAGG